MKKLLAIFFCGLVCVACFSAQELDSAKLLKPPTDTWPTFNGDYTGRRFSPLTQINKDNVGSLTLAWAFQTRAQPAVYATPLEVNGVLYFSVSNQAWAVDARTGRQIWHFDHPFNGYTLGGGSRGVAMYKDRIFFGTGDGYLYCLDARNGKTLWSTELADIAFKAFMSMAPLVIKDHLLVAVSGDVADIPGWLESLDPMTGKVQWRWDAMPKEGEPGWDTWPHDTDVISRGGGTLWLTGTYDPELNLTYWGTGNPHPVEAPDARLGANLYTCTIVALNPDTGKLVWYFQPSPHDSHDWDAVQTPVLIDGTYKGKPRKMLAQASRNGLYFLLDRTNGQALVHEPYIPINWVAGFDERGQPIPKKETEPQLNGALAMPGAAGGTNWMAPSFSPQTGLFYATARESSGVYFVTMPGKHVEGWGGRDFILHSKSVLKAIDYQTGKVRWTRDLSSPGGGGWPSVLTTAGHLLFTTDDSGKILALDPATGETLWHVYGGRISTCAPITYELDGRQYVITPLEGVVYAWALPSRPAAPAAKATAAKAAR
ncbi:MAG: acido-empty-quinoprotein group A [Candidatus Acidiferrales bacterium]|jgi:alcohol dehydrogenase (cytochrome c)